MRKLSGVVNNSSGSPLSLSVVVPPPPQQQQQRQQPTEGSDCSQVTYEPLHVLGQGSFGVVMMARARETGKVAAIKKVLFDGRLHHRELLLLRDHLGPNISQSPQAPAGNDSPKNNETENKDGQGDGDEKNDDHKGSGSGSSIDAAGAAAAVSSLRENVTPLEGPVHVPTIVPYHPNIVKFLDHFTSCGPNGEQYLYIVMDYLPSDIYRLQYTYVRQKQQRMPLIMVKVTMFQLARALLFLHSRNICHRDVKPSNLLIDPETGVLKLCDFGSAKVMQPQSVNGPREKNVSYICSRYYRAPELLLGSLYYHFHVDMWAAGCVLAELLCGEVLFKGGSTVDQMAEIFKVLGSPSRQELLTLNPQSAEALFHAARADMEIPPATSSSTGTNNSDYLHRYHALRIKSLQWQRVLPPNTPPAAVSLVGALLRYTPAERLTAAEVLEHSFFDDIFAEDACLPNGKPLPVSMFQLTADECEILPHWMLERMASAELFAKRRQTNPDVGSTASPK